MAHQALQEQLLQMVTLGLQELMVHQVQVVQEEHQGEQREVVIQVLQVQMELQEVVVIVV